MTKAGTLSLKTAISSYPHFVELRNGNVKPRGAEFDFVELRSGIDGYRRMTRALEFDVNEMTLVNYMLAKEHGRAFTAIPIFPSRRFHHDLLFFNADTGVREPKDIEGKKFAMRSYTVTPATWLRGLLGHEYGVDLDRVTWVINDEEHVTEYKLPPNVEYRPGADLLRAVKDGEIAGAHTSIGRPDAPNLRFFFPNADAVKRDYLRKTGFVWTNHVIVVKDALLQENPWLGPALFEAFKEAKDRCLKLDPTAEIGGVAGVAETDRLPYGLEANREVLETLVTWCREQKILSRSMPIDALFVRSTIAMS